MEVASHSTIRSIARDDWERIFPGQAENWDYYLATERVPPEGFAIEYLAVRDEGTVIAAAPVFHTRHHLHASLTGGARRFLDRLSKRFPRAMSLGITGWGSPLVDRCHLGFHPQLPMQQRRDALQALYQGLETHAAENQSALLVAKDVTEATAAEIDGWMAALGFGRMRSLPNVRLCLPYQDWDTYLASRSRRISGYLKRKEKQAQGLQVSCVSKLDKESARRVHDLYERTRQNAAGDYGDFEKLHPDYFASAIEAAPGADVNFLTASVDGRIIGALMFIRGPEETVWTFIGMEYPIARKLNVYFVLVNHLIRDCIANDAGSLRMGNTSYGPKFLYGGQLETHWVYMKHRSSLLNPAFRRLAPLFDYETNDPELRRLRQDRDKYAARIVNRAE
jgi:hypothetical protein